MPGPRRRDDRGAVALLTAVAMALLVAVAAFGVDLGMQRVVRRDMQAVADTVAFDLARQVDGRTAATITASPSWATAKTQTVERNAGSSLGSTPNIQVELGTVDSAFAFTPASGTTVPSAVRVTASASVDFSFTSGSGSAERSAVAVARAQACYKLGSWGARLSTASNANLVYQVLSAHGIGASVGAVTYQSLAGAHVDLAALSTALGLASPESLATTTVSLSALLDAAATVVGSNGSTGAQVSALNLVRANLGTLGTRTFSLANLASVASGAGSGLSAGANLADLVVGAVLLADGGTAAQVDLTGDVPNVGSFPASVGLVQRAKAACGFAGSTPNSSNQVSLSATTALAPGLDLLASLLNGIASLAGLSVTGLSGPSVQLNVSSGSASSTLDAVTCGSASKSATVSTSGGLLEVTLKVPVSVQVLAIPGGLTTVKGTIVAEVSAPGETATVTLTGPPYDMAYPNGGSPLELGSPYVDLPTIESGSLSDAKAKAVLEAVVTRVITPIVIALNSALIDPLSQLLGLSTAGADVFLLDHPSCTTPALRG